MVKRLLGRLPRRVGKWLGWDEMAAACERSYERLRDWHD